MAKTKPIFSLCKCQKGIFGGFYEIAKFILIFWTMYNAPEENKYMFDDPIPRLFMPCKSEIKLIPMKNLVPLIEEHFQLQKVTENSFKLTSPDKSMDTFYQEIFPKMQKRRIYLEEIVEPQKTARRECLLENAERMASYSAKISHTTIVFLFLLYFVSSNFKYVEVDGLRTFLCAMAMICLCFYTFLMLIFLLHAPADVQYATENVSEKFYM